MIGLVALIRLHLARWPARVDSRGALIVLEKQDRSLWDPHAIADATRLIEKASAVGRPGPYLIEASIAAVHCEAKRSEDTDWPQILALYNVLAEFDQSPIVKLNRAIALRYVGGPEAALCEVEATGPLLSRYHLYHATRAALLRQLGRLTEADLAEAEVIRLTQNSAEKELMAKRMAAPSAADMS